MLAKCFEITYTCKCVYHTHRREVCQWNKYCEQTIVWGVPTQEQICYKHSEFQPPIKHLIQTASNVTAFFQRKCLSVGILFACSFEVSVIEKLTAVMCTRLCSNTVFLSLAEFWGLAGTCVPKPISVTGIFLDLVKFSSSVVLYFTRIVIKTFHKARLLCISTTFS